MPNITTYSSRDIYKNSPKHRKFTTFLPEIASKSVNSQDNCGTDRGMEKEATIGIFNFDEKRPYTSCNVSTR